MEGVVEDIFSKLVNTSTSALESYADSLLNSTPKNTVDYESYGEEPSQLPQILLSGLWAAPITSEQVQNMDLQFTHGAYASVVSIYLQTSGVYMVFTTNMTVYGGNTCNADLTDELERECFAVNGVTTAFFWLKTGYTYPQNGYSKITGFDNSTLQKYGLDRVSLASAWLQSYQSTGGEGWTVKSAISHASSTFTGQEYLFASLQVCNLTEANITAVTSTTKRSDFECTNNGVSLSSAIL